MHNELAELDVSKLSRDQQDIIGCIGIESYYKLTKNYGGSTIYIAKSCAIDVQKRNKKIISEFRKGASYKELAVKYGLSTIWIRNIVDKKS